MIFGTVMRAGVAALVLAAMPQTLAARAPDGATGDAAEAPCTFDSATSDQMNAVIAVYGARLDDFDGFCRRLVSAGMGVDVSEFSNVQNDQTAAIVVLSLYDLATQVRGPESTMRLNLVAGTDDTAREEALSAAFDDALQDVAAELERYSGSVTAEVARQRALFAKEVPTFVPAVEEGCSLFVSSTPEIEQAIDRWQGVPDFDGYDAVCPVLRERGVGLGLSGGAVELEGQSQSWASVVVFDRATGVIGGARAFALGFGPDASPEALEADMKEAVEVALGGIADSLDTVLNQLDQNVLASRRAFVAVH